jgi:two-component system chemotaxis response regulator CheY
MGFTILIVDDSAVMRRIIRRVLSVTGINFREVLEAGNGTAALEIMNSRPVDIVLADLNLPVMSGGELIAAMRRTESLSKIPVIVVSTEGRSERIEELRSLGVHGYVKKPFAPEEIAHIICETLGVKADGRFVEEPQDSDF